jgi:hypothetical protein
MAPTQPPPDRQTSSVPQAESSDVFWHPVPAAPPAPTQTSVVHPVKSSHAPFEGASLHPVVGLHVGIVHEKPSLSQRVLTGE